MRCVCVLFEGSGLFDFRTYTSERARPNKTGTCIGRFQISLGSHGAAASSSGGGEDPVIFGASEASRRVNWVSEKFRLIIF